MLKTFIAEVTLLLATTFCIFVTISSAEKSEKNVNHLEINLDRLATNVSSNYSIASNHRPVYTPPINTSQLQLQPTNDSQMKLSLMQMPQMYEVNAPRLNQVEVPRENYIKTPQMERLIITTTLKPQQIQDIQKLHIQRPIVVSPTSDLKTLNYVSPSSAEQRLLWKLGKHPPNCPNHPFPPVCGGVFAGPTALRHPGFPGPYPPLVKCTYTVLSRSPALPRSCFKVSFINVAIRWSPNCHQDWLQIDQGARLCGGLSGDKYYQTPGNLIIEFHSEHIPGPPGSGFHILITQIPCQILDPPSHRPPPPHVCPRPPGHFPPGYNNHSPNHHHPPPGHYPPNYGPPNHPPIVRPPPREETPFWWRWYRVLKCEWSGIKNLPPGLCPDNQSRPSPHKPPYIPPTLPHRTTPPYLPPPAKPYSPIPPIPSPNTPRPPTVGPPSPPVSETCSRFVAMSQFLVNSKEWLPQRAPGGQNRGWNCELSIIKASPAACEVFLQLENLQLECDIEFLEIGGQRVCGTQPFRQLSVDFRGYEVKIIYHKIGRADISPGNFVIRGFQNFDCEPLILDVTPAKKLRSPLIATTPTISTGL